MLIRHAGLFNLIMMGKVEGKIDGDEKGYK